jgi:hypothetical protein
VEWLKVKALSSSPNTAKKKKKILEEKILTCDCEIKNMKRSGVPVAQTCNPS